MACKFGTGGVTLQMMPGHYRARLETQQLRNVLVDLYRSTDATNRTASPLTILEFGTRSVYSAVDSVQPTISFACSRLVRSVFCRR